MKKKNRKQRGGIIYFSMKPPFQLAYTMYMYLNYTVMYSIATLLQMKTKV